MCPMTIAGVVLEEVPATITAEVRPPEPVSSTGTDGAGRRLQPEADARDLELIAGVER